MRRDSNAHRQKYALSVAGGGHGHEHEKQCHRAQDHRVHPDIQSAAPVEHAMRVLRRGWMGALVILALAAGVPDATATNATEAWTALKRERAIVLWLEARRLGDLRRWAANGTPGALDALEMVSGDAPVGSHLAQQDLCVPTPPSEQDTNPNVPSAGG